MGRGNQFLRIGPSSVLTPQGLLINGEKQQLRHAQDFNHFVLSTCSIVCTVLESLFPNTIAVPSLGGTATPSQEPAWEHYNRHVHALQFLPHGTTEAISAGEVVLQWCIAAAAAAELKQANVKNTPQFLPILFLLKEAPAAIPCAPSHWADYLVWLEEQQTYDAVLRRLQGFDERPNPRPEALRVTSPWPEWLGLTLENNTSTLEKACLLASDIVITKKTSEQHSGAAALVSPARLSYHGHFLSIDLDDTLVDQFDAAAAETTSLTVERGMSICVDNRQLFIRAQRHLFKDTRYYSFRLLPSQVPKHLSLV